MDDRTEQWRALTAALERTLREHAPGWTDHSGHDPGLTILEIIAYLGDNLQRNTSGVAGGEMAATSRTVRPNFFSGRLLTTDDLRDEQAYHREKHRRHLRLLHGVGVAYGLKVGVASDGTTVSVEPGYAIDANGNELVVPDVIVVPIPSDAPSPTCVVVQFIERMMDPVPTADGRSEPSRIEESCDVSLAPGPCDAGVTLARLIWEKASWRVDPAFTPTRLFTRRGW